MQYDNFQVGEIILIPFPFTDLSSVKTRPAIVLSGDTLHQEDIIIGAISSKKGEHDIPLFSQDFTKGNLPLVSYFKKGKIVTVHISIVQKVIGQLGQEKTKEILEVTRGLF